MEFKSEFANSSPNLHEHEIQRVSDFENFGMDGFIGLPRVIYRTFFFFKSYSRRRKPKTMARNRVEKTAKSTKC